MSGHPPDVFIVVLDAVRGSDIYSDRNGTIGDLPFLSRFSREAAVYPQASAVAAWTLPAMATFVTGLYPWEHGVSAMGRSTLDPSMPTLASLLRNHGYSTTLLSANNVVGPRTNLSAGFERVYVSDWWEQYLRVARPMRASKVRGPEGTADDKSRVERRPEIEKVLRRGMRMGFRFPGLLERTNELVQRVRSPETPPGVSVSPWIEEVLRELLVETPPTRPILVVAHLNDAHEPYFRAPMQTGQPPMVRQDYMRRIEGTWSPTEAEFAALHELYRGMIRSLDHRLEGLLNLFSERRDIDNTLVLVTADHGQAFGEGGWLFHMSSPEESLLRIPMIVRFPNHSPAGRGRGWASTVDVVPTVMEVAGLREPGREGARSLRDLFEGERSAPAWALGDGLPLRHLEGIVSGPSTVRQGTATRRWLAAYDGPFKTVYDFASRTFTELRVDVAGNVESGSAATHSPEGQSRIREEAVRLSEELLGRERLRAMDVVSRRLESWGYGA